jgi:hypothetical protein
LKPDEPPVMRPRGVSVLEVSLVHWLAYDSARVSSLSVRTRADQRRHEESERFIREWEMERVEREAKPRAALLRKTA